MRAKKALDQAPTGLYSSTIKPPLHNNIQRQENNLEKSKKNKFTSPEAIYGNKIDGEAYNMFDVNRFDDSPRLNYDEQKLNRRLKTY